MKYILIGDLHIDKYIDLIDEIITLLDQCLNNDIKNVIIPGDIFEQHKHGNSYAINQLQNLFSNYSDKVFWLLIGNHDIYHLNKLKPNTIETSFKNIPNVKIIYKPTEIDNILLVPWIVKNNYVECIDSIKQTKKEYCVGHFEFNGFYSSIGMKYEKGFNISEFSKFKKVMSSHFHIRQEMKNILYLGSIRQFSWNDFGNIKGYHILDTENDKIEFIPIGKDIYQKIILESNETDFDIDNYKDCVIKLYHHEKLTKKQFEKIEELKQVVKSYQIFDESIDLNEVKIENVEFKDMLDEFLVEQEFDDDFKNEIKEYMNFKYEEI